MHYPHQLLPAWPFALIQHCARLALARLRFSHDSSLSAALPQDPRSAGSRLRRSRAVSAFMAALGGAAVFAQTAPAPAVSSSKEEVVQLGAFVTLGSRFGDRTVVSSPLPIDVFSKEDVQGGGYTELAQVLSVLVPSLTFPRPTNTDGTDHIRPATLRGLGPDQVLVLLNGKRRHTSSLVNINSSVGRGSAAVDLNAIPSFALGGAEVLRDGAAAIYGSDAIAGVINFSLRKETGVRTTTTVGQTYNHDGATIDASINAGAPLGQSGGFINVTAYFRNRGFVDRAGADLRQQYFGTNPATGALVLPATVRGQVNGTPDPREATFQRHNARFGDPISHRRGIFINLGAPLAGKNLDFYAFGGINRHQSTSFASWRRPADNNTIRAFYPDGFQPLMVGRVIDRSIVAGLKGEAGKWKWDVSQAYGGNDLQYWTNHTANVSYGTASRKDFYDGKLAFQQATTNLDVSRQFAAGLPAPLKVAFGAEYRWENYQITAGDRDSWADGGQRVLDGPRAGTIPLFGAQGFPGFRPTDEANASRDNTAGYVDVESQLTDRWLVDLAGRFERYSDAGSTTTGKFSSILRLLDWLRIRGSASTGFRAPSLQQEFFSTTSSNIISVLGVLQPVEIKTFQVGDPVARALGSTPLRPEKSVNYTVGLTLTPFEKFTMSADYYYLTVKDRVVLSSNFATTAVANFLATQGYPGVGGGRYFTNGVDMRVRGIDVTARHKLNLPSGHTLTLVGAYNFNDIALTFIKPTPANILALTGGTPIFDRQNILRFERGTPRDKYSLSATYAAGKRHSLTVREVRYGKCLQPGITAATDQELSPKWLTDVELNFRLNAHVSLALGASNVFNVYPDKSSPAVNTTGLNQYSVFSPFGRTGGFYFTRVDVKF